MNERLTRMIGFDLCGFGPRAALLTVLFSASILPMPGRGDDGAVSDGQSVFEQFKKFIEDPPPIEDIVFSFEGSAVSRLDTVQKQWVNQGAPTVYFRAKWCPGFLLNVTMPSLKELEVEPLSHEFELKGGAMVLQNEDMFWSFLGRESRVTSWTGPLTYPIDLTNPVLLHYNLSNLPFFSLLSMGPHFVPPHSIRWSGNRFRYLAKLFDGDISIEGELFQAPRGLPEKMTLTYRGSTVYGRYLVRYEFAATALKVPRFIPGRILSVVLHGDKEVPDKDIRLISLILAHRPQGVADYVPSNWISQKRLSQFVYTNKDLYAIEPGGGMRLVPRLKKPPEPPYTLAHANRYYYVACGLISAAFVQINWRMRRQNKQNQTERKEKHAK